MVATKIPYPLRTGLVVDPYTYNVRPDFYDGLPLPTILGLASVVLPHTYHVRAGFCGGAFLSNTLGLASVVALPVRVGFCLLSLNLLCQC